MWRIGSLDKTNPVASQGHSHVTTRPHQTPSVDQGSGHRVDVIDSGDYRFLVTLAYDGRWRITRWQPLA